MTHEVVLYTLGGTIAMGGHHADPADTPPNATSPDLARRGVIARLTGADLSADVPGLEQTGVELRIADVAGIPSADLTFAQVLDVVREATAAVRAGAAGVVITQGTDTLEESAYLADLVWPHSEPIVFTGAMRNPTLAGPDGPANLLAAVRAAASPHTADLGAIVAFDDELHAARWVRKTHATATGTFQSPDAGPIGRFEEERVRVLSALRRRTPLAIPDAEALAGARVALHTAVLDDDSEALDTVAARYAGLVVAGYGVGHVSSRLVPALADLAARIPVVLTSRTGAGPVLRHTYGAPGGEIDLQRRGLINGGMLHPYKARVLLRLLLAAGAGREEIAAAFAEHG